MSAAAPPGFWHDENGQLWTTSPGGVTTTAPTRLMLTVTTLKLEEAK